MLFHRLLSKNLLITGYTEIDAGRNDPRLLILKTLKTLILLGVETYKIFIFLLSSESIAKSETRVS